MNAAAARKSSLPACVACLYRVGWGTRRVCRHTGYAKTTVHRFATWHGLIDEQTAATKKRAEDERRKRAAAAKPQPVKQQREPRPKLTDEERRARARAYYYANHERAKAASRESAKRRYEQLKHDAGYRAKKRATTKAWKQRNRPTTARPVAFKAIIGQRKRILRKLRRRLRDYVFTRGTVHLPLIGCTSLQLAQHLESQWQPGMSWDSYGQWHIDHIKPCASFDLTQPDQQLLCFHYSNLQPLWAMDNIRKGASVVTVAAA